MTKGINDLLLAKGIKKSDLRNNMKQIGIPFPYAYLETFYNMINGNTKPKDPYIYIYFSTVLNVPVDEIIMRYSSVNSFNHEVIKGIDEAINDGSIEQLNTLN